MSKKHTIEFIRSQVSKLAPGYQCLSTEYINSKTKLNLVCKNSHQFLTSYNSFQRGSRCSKCAGLKKLTIEFVKSKVLKLEPGYQCLSTEYKNSTSKLNFICDQGHEYLSTWSIFNSGSRCPKCFSKVGRPKPTIGFVKNEVSRLAPGYQCLSDIYINGYNQKLNFICDRGHNYQAKYQDFRTGRRCPKCKVVNKTGLGHPRYNHDLTEQERLEHKDRSYNFQSRQWRKAVYERDQHTCQFCLNVGGKLNAHHIHNYADHKDLRYNVDNGITLCVTCHKEFHRLFGRKHNDRNQLNRWFTSKEKLLKTREIMKSIDQKLQTIT